MNYTAFLYFSRYPEMNKSESFSSIEEAREYLSCFWLEMGMSSCSGEHWHGVGRYGLISDNYPF